MLVKTSPYLPSVHPNPQEKPSHSRKYPFVHEPHVVFRGDVQVAHVWSQGWHVN